MKFTASVAAKLMIAAVGGWGLGVFVSQPFVDKVEQQPVVKQTTYKLVQQNAEWNKKNTVKGIDKIPNCTYVYEDVSNNKIIRCKLPCITLYKGSQLLYRWEADIMMKNNLTAKMVQEKMK